MAVYFIDDRRGAIKIGYSEYPPTRLNSIQSYHAFEIILLGVMEGDENLEKKLHNRFSHLCLRGEWFLKAKELLEFIVTSFPEIDIEAIKDDDFIAIDARAELRLREIESEAAKIIGDAKIEADMIIGNAKRRIEEEVNKCDIPQLAKSLADNLLNKARYKAHDIIADAKLKSCARIREARLAGKDIIDEAKIEAATIMAKTRVRQDEILKESRLQAIESRSFLRDFVQKKGWDFFIDDKDIFIFACRCIRCGQTSETVREREDGLPYCQQCWNQRLDYLDIADRGRKMGLGIDNG